MRLRPYVRTIWLVISRTADEGTIHAGNLAYLSLTSLFPLFVIIASIAGAMGRTDAGLEALTIFMSQLPGDVAQSLSGPISELVSRSASGGLLTIGILVGLWSVSNYVGTIRDIIRRAHGAPPGSVWRERLTSIAGILLAVILLLVAFAAQFLLVAAEQVITRLLPMFSEVLNLLAVSRIGPGVIIFLALYALFKLLTPRRIGREKREWPGALLTTIVWLGATTLLPRILSTVANFQMTYGSLAGVMISLLFFYVVGLGLVAGANLNATLAGSKTLAEREQTELK